VLQRRCQGRPVRIVFGTSVDKEAGPMLKRLGSIADELILTRFHGNPRFRSPHDLIDLLPVPFRDSPIVLEDPIEACRYALEQSPDGGVVVVCGSFFLAAETRHWFASQAHSRDR